MKQKQECPKCGSPKTAEVVYGYPTEETFAKARKGLVELGGCCRDSDDPDMVCRACGFGWQKRRA